jgi:hypothetical protein
VRDLASLDKKRTSQLKKFVKGLSVSGTHLRDRARPKQITDIETGAEKCEFEKDGRKTNVAVSRHTHRVKSDLSIHASFSSDISKTRTTSG